ncbi:Transcriptional regulator, AraC family [Labilithrix luteola]|uniref:Transcriptional regulator, AraC family n=1 Tax=Labilithrix luteola TaxID=1391654 RepID=A0A0K1Q649_9BACT|nr:AraC family transcriptional regulator [Labilithrix luteola]AKV00880.1 Transcriptional regulator, AraC family [Labilithrix luteola]
MNALSCISESSLVAPPSSTSAIAAKAVLEAPASANDGVAARTVPGRREVSSRARALMTVLGVRSLLDDSYLSPDVEPIAKTMGVSVRTLQRRLFAHETSFEREVSLARVRRAQRLMLETNLPLSRVATECGFSSLSRLSVVFRKMQGTTPSEWRRANRNRPAAPVTEVENPPEESALPTAPDSVALATAT